VRSVVVPCLCAIFIVALSAELSGCAGVGSRSNADSKGTSVPDIARVVCDRAGSRMLTPEVRARRDGVHFEIQNRLDKDTGYAVATPDGGMGGNAPKGRSRHIEDFPPGEISIGCYPSRDADPDYAKMMVLAGDSDYKSVELECPGGMSVSSGGGLYAPGAKGEKRDPAELVRRRFSKQLDEGDVVETAGYPDHENGKTVRATRDRQIVAVFEYRRVKGGWLENGYSACADF